MTARGYIKKLIQTMNFLEEKILKDGIIIQGNILKIDSFLNHQIDIGIIR